MAVKFLSFATLLEAKEFIERINELSGYPTANVSRYADVVEKDGSEYLVKLRNSDVFNKITADEEAAAGTDFKLEVESAVLVKTETVVGEVDPDYLYLGQEDNFELTTEDSDFLYA